MGTFRLYTGSDRESHIEPLDLGRTLEWMKGLATTQISCRKWPIGQHLDWRPAPRRQFVIVLSGQLEIRLGDGGKHVFGPGDARLVEDTTGRGAIYGQTIVVVPSRRLVIARFGICRLTADTIAAL